MHSNDIITASDFFQCTQCNDCCKGFGGTYVTDQELAAIAGYLKISAEQVRARYCALSGNKPVLAQGVSGYCVFLKGNCGIHPVKPHMCRRWPFIPNLLNDVSNWFAMADSCPGMRKDVDVSALLAFVQREMAKPGY